MQIEYLFKPNQIINIINRYPCIKGKIDPSKEGAPSTSFPLARKTGREIYRILCNQHYPHLQELLKNLDYCLKKGWEQPTLLRTRSGKEFHSAVSELMVAEHLAKIGFEISSFDQNKKQESVPDLLVTKDNWSCACEVYAPRDWDGLDDFKEDIRLSLLHLDIPWDFVFKIRMKLASNFDGKGHLRNFDPWQFSDNYNDPKRRSQKITPFIDEISDRIQKSNGSRTRNELIDKPNNTITEITVDQIQPNQYCLPARKGGISGPPLTGYAPELMFDRLLQGRIHSKIKKGQAATIKDADLHALFVNVSRLVYKSEFDGSYYLGEFKKSIEKYFYPNSLRVDTVIFFQPNLSNGIEIIDPLLFTKNGILAAQINSLLGIR